MAQRGNGITSMWTPSSAARWKTFIRLSKAIIRAAPLHRDQEKGSSDYQTQKVVKIPLVLNCTQIVNTQIGSRWWYRILISTFQGLVLEFKFVAMSYEHSRARATINRKVDSTPSLIRVTNLVVTPIMPIRSNQAPTPEKKRTLESP